MKRLLTLAVLLCVATSLIAQQPKPPAKPPASPAAKESAMIGGKAVTVTYSSPGVKGRAGKLFGKDGQIGKDPTYPVWRAGANSATALHLEADTRIGGREGFLAPAGDYTLYVDVSDPANWVLVVNKQTGQWGTKYDKAQDLGRVKMTMAATPALVENLKYSIADRGDGRGTLTLEWENLSAAVNLRVRPAAN